MSQLTQTTFSINGDVVPVYKTFLLKQGIFEHHSFTLVCPADAVDGKEGFFSASKDIIGAGFGARIVATELQQGLLIFKGIITKVETSRYSGHLGDVIITGYSSTIVMESGLHCQSWEEKTVKNIALDVLRLFPKNILEPKVQPLYREVLPYTVQYKETTWEFLQRLTATYGEWLFWDGQGLVIGPPGSNTLIQLTYGAHLSHFTMSLHTRPLQSRYVTWDYMNSKIYTSSPENIAQKAGLNHWGEKVLLQGQFIYNTQPKLYNNRFTTDLKQQDDLVALRSAMESSRMVQFSGESGHPGVQLGSRIEVTGNNVFTEKTEGYGQYLITGIEHQVDSMGNYKNQFSAVPSGIKVPPVSVPFEPVCEAQSAIVTDNNDYHGLGRIRVRFHWMESDEKSPWIRVTSPHAGGGKGHFFIPEIGEEVLVGFEGNLATRPYVIGTVYHGEANNNFSNEGNDIKIIQTRSGTKVRMNDAEGSIYIEDPSGNTWFMDGNGNISMNAPNDISIVAGKNFNITVGENMTTSVGMNKINTVGMNNTESVGATKITSVVGDTSMFITGKLTEMIEGDVHSEVKNGKTVMNSEQGIETSCSASIHHEAQKEVHNNSGEMSKSF